MTTRAEHGNYPIGEAHLKKHENHVTANPDGSRFSQSEVCRLLLPSACYFESNSCRCRCSIKWCLAARLPTEFMASRALSLAHS